MWLSDNLYLKIAIIKNMKYLTQSHIDMEDALDNCQILFN